MGSLSIIGGVKYTAMLIAKKHSKVMLLQWEKTIWYRPDLIICFSSYEAIRCTRFQIWSLESKSSSVQSLRRMLVKEWRTKQTRSDWIYRAQLQHYNWEAYQTCTNMIIQCLFHSSWEIFVLINCFVFVDFPTECSIP